MSQSESLMQVLYECYVPDEALKFCQGVFEAVGRDSDIGDMSYFQMTHLIRALGGYDDVLEDSLTEVDDSIVYPSFTERNEWTSNPAILAMGKLVQILGYSTDRQ